jgi:hypothetical protein
MSHTITDVLRLGGNDRGNSPGGGGGTTGNGRWQDPDRLVCPGCGERVRPEAYLEPLGRGLGCS